jgi:hypothetical protein
MKLTLICKHGEWSTEIEGDSYAVAHPEAGLMPLCPYCEIVERPKAKCNAKAWLPIMVANPPEAPR